ncbi:hypothetical protein B0F90DRAFT_1666983 [Multifurca ochricompacta]|uniref:Uncharacterized protein n=1 Tax=Multifurca ochricompacta TaxID=376703 RepID=A0AAD4M749_9AGAM|nr:hypothetical protein B0F90DRAFT_1666983 [Multifurca ochricompacta]
MWREPSTDALGSTVERRSTLRMGTRQLDLASTRKPVKTMDILVGPEGTKVLEIHDARFAAEARVRKTQRERNKVYRSKSEAESLAKSSQGYIIGAIGTSGSGQEGYSSSIGLTVSREFEVEVVLTSSKLLSTQSEAKKDSDSGIPELTSLSGRTTSPIKNTVECYRAKGALKALLVR